MVLQWRIDALAEFNWASLSKNPIDFSVLETLLLLSERFRKSIDWILRGEGN
jgi:hypothetical protein